MPLTLVRVFDVTIPAGTLKAAPLVTLTQFEPNVVERIDWLFPDGCQGTVGIQIGARATPILPDMPGQYIIRSGDSSGYDLSGVHTTGDWSVIGYNTGQFPHTIHVTYRVRRYEPPPKMIFITDARIAHFGLGES